MRYRVILALVISFGISRMAYGSDALVTIESDLWHDTKAVVSCIEAYGGTVKIVVVPHFIFADIPEGVDDEIISVSPASSIYRGTVEPGQLGDYGTGARSIGVAWNNVFMGQAHKMGLDEKPSPDHLPLINDADPPLDRSMLPLKPPGARFYDTSEFMLGTVALGVFLPESDGSIDPNLEDWTQTEQDEVTSEVISGLNWYVTKANWRDLTFYTVFHYSVQIGYEPISRPSTDESRWIPACLEAIGYVPATYPGTMYAYANDLRDSLGTDWAVLSFIVDSSNDSDDKFEDGRFAYSNLGGPKFVMTYGNDGWGIANMDAVLAHEISHSFYALDEYYEAGVGCTARSGYLNAENQNSEYPNGPGGCEINAIFCIMRSKQLSVARVCYYTKGHIGWWDSDDDSIPDILDTCPETILYEYSPDPCSTFTPTYAGSCWVVKLDNQNPYGTGHDITLNRIDRVEYRVDAGAWHEALPNDGAWDEGREGFHFTTEPLSVGMHIIEARAFHTYGNYDTTYAVDTLTVEGSGVGKVVTSRINVNAYPNPFGPQVEIEYSVPGKYGNGVPVQVTVYDVKGRTVAGLMRGVVSPGIHRVRWCGTYPDGTPAPSGIYFVEVVAGTTRLVKKIVMTR